MKLCHNMNKYIYFLGVYMIKILHTSDWHLGKSLYDFPRYKEFQKFLDFLYGVLKKHQIEILLICGDIFDTQVASNQSQELYYNFLNKVQTLKSLENIVIIGGNHDSPTFLKAARQILKNLKVEIVSSFTGNLEDEVLTLYDKQGNPKLIIGAVPFLRNRDVREASFGEELEQRNLNLRQGMAAHYQKVGNLCKKAAHITNPPLPIIGTGHLALSSMLHTSKNHDENIFIGTLDMFDAQIIPKCFSYTALGHMHKPIKISDTIYYCGSPLQLNFNEAASCKYLNLIELSDKAEVTQIEVPIFQKIKSLLGDKQALLSELKKLISLNESFLVELNYNGNTPIGTLYDNAHELCEGTQVKILIIRDLNIRIKSLNPQYTGEILSEISVQEVFNRCLKENNIHEDDLIEYQNTFKELLEQMHNQ